MGARNGAATSEAPLETTMAPNKASTNNKTRSELRVGKRVARWKLADGGWIERKVGV